MFKKFLELESAGGMVLVAAAAVALIAANSPFHAAYDYILNSAHILGHSPLHWINDGLMAVFFYLVGLEIRREFAQGELSSRGRALLPAIAALGGMIVPALIYISINFSSPENLRGWAIPSATDIAFSLGVLSLLGTRVPLQLKILLTAIAIIDDLGAILIIALFYAQALDPAYISLAIGTALALYLMKRAGVRPLLPYLLLGALLWLAMLHSGIHATLAGVLLAMLVPVHTIEPQMHKLHPYVAFGVLPLFSFANAGVPFTGMGLHSLFDPLTLGIVLGLFVGKQMGIFMALWIAVKTRLSPMPAETNWLQLYGMSILCGIGFTMSLFIGGLAFTGTGQQAEIRLGVLCGSLLSAVAGYLILRMQK